MVTHRKAVEKMYINRYIIHIKQNKPNSSKTGHNRDVNPA